VPLVSTTLWLGQQIPQAWAQASDSTVPDRLTFSAANEPIGNMAITMAAMRSNRVEDMMNYLGILLIDRTNPIIVTALS
jgi:hypothetical protein